MPGLNMAQKSARKYRRAKAILTTARTNQCLRLLLTLAVVVGCLVVNIASAEAQCTHVKTYNLGGSNLKLRPQPNTTQAHTALIPEGTCLAVQAKVTGENINGDTAWYKVSYSGSVGYVSGYFAQCSTCGGPPPECTGSQTRGCYSGSASTRGRGECKDGTQTCSGGKWGTCAGSRGPAAEGCDGKDNDCDGQTDENNPGGGATCSTGQSGACGQGTRSCEGGKLVCKAKTQAKAEACNGVDDNCNGQVDENNPGGGSGCNTGKPGTCAQGLNKCVNGKLMCEPTQPGNAKETCDNIDNDCNGTIDDGLQRPCYTGPPNTNGIGVCAGGQQKCVAGKWASCDGELTPAGKEICNNSKDDNCDGAVDEGCGPGSACKDGEKQSCYTGPAATQNKGACKDGNQVCSGGTWEKCNNEVLPAPKEICNNQTDDNCDGAVDEGCGGPQGTCEDKDNDTFGVGTTCTGPQDCDDNNPDVNPNATEICGNDVDEDCKGGALPCGKLGLGEAGCTKPSECETNFCVKNGTIQRCSQSCKINSDCPAGYTCLQETACWPPKKGGDAGQATPCNVNAQCDQNQFCDQVVGFCAEKRGGCGCAAGQPTPPFNPLFLGLLIGLIVTRRKLRRGA